MSDEYDQAEIDYDRIREDTRDIACIAAVVGCKPRTVAAVKRHLFFDLHQLDRYRTEGEPVVLRRFDANPDIAAAWHRLRAGVPVASDRQLLRHEVAGAWYMRRYGPSYNAAHTAAQRRYHGGRRRSDAVHAQSKPADGFPRDGTDP